MSLSKLLNQRSRPAEPHSKGPEGKDTKTKETAGFSNLDILRAGWLTRALLSLVLCVGFEAGVAQEFALNWFSIDGGGGVSSGDDYSISGIIGQPDAGVMAAGEFALEGGFWGVIAPVKSGSPELRLVVTETNTVVIAWPTNPPGFSLQQTSDLTAADWLEVTDQLTTVGSENQVILLPAAGSRFFRLFHP